MDDDLILDVSVAYDKFREDVRPLVADFKQFAQDTITTILEYIQQTKEADGMLEECARHIEEALASEKMATADTDIIKEAVFKLGEAILANLRDVGAYNEHGELGFKFKQMLGKDIVLEPISPEDYGSPAADDGEGFDPFDDDEDDD